MSRATKSSTSLNFEEDHVGGIDDCEEQVRDMKKGFPGPGAPIVDGVEEGEDVVDRHFGVALFVMNFCYSMPLKWTFVVCVVKGVGYKLFYARPFNRVSLTFILARPNRK